MFGIGGELNAPPPQFCGIKQSHCSARRARLGVNSTYIPRVTAERAATKQAHLGSAPVLAQEICPWAEPQPASLIRLIEAPVCLKSIRSKGVAAAPRIFGGARHLQRRTGAAARTRLPSLVLQIARGRNHSRPRWLDPMCDSGGRAGRHHAGRGAASLSAARFDGGQATDGLIGVIRLSRTVRRNRAPREARP
jgi:hypothetical protein